MNVNSPIRVGNLTIRYLVDGTQSGGMGLFELEVPPGSNVPPPHSHTHNEECVYVLEGNTTLFSRRCYEGFTSR